MHARADPNERKSWAVVAPFFSTHSENLWIDDFIENSSWKFRKVPLRSAQDDWHLRSKRATGTAKWLEYWDQSRRVFPAAGAITVFPQPAFMVGLQKRLRRADIPLLAWCFNLGQFPRGLKRAAARAALRSVDRFVVHSTGEIAKVSEFLEIPPHKVEFVPLQRAPIEIEVGEDLDSPFIVAMGSANRDYATFVKAAEMTRLPCKIVASPRSLEGLQIPSNIAVESGLSASECHRLVQRSRFSVVPLADPEVASGQVTVNESMRMDRPVIATRSIGTVDYIRDGKTGRLVPPHEPEALAAAMLQLWEDKALRERYARNAAQFAETSLSDEAAARSLARIITELESEQ